MCFRQQFKCPRTDLAVTKSFSILCKVALVVFLQDGCVDFPDSLLSEKRQFSSTNLVTSCATFSSSTLRQTEFLTILSRLEAVLVAAAAAVPEANAFPLIAVKEPHDGVVLAVAGVLAEGAGWRQERFTCHSSLQFTDSFLVMKCVVATNHTCFHVS